MDRWWARKEHLTPAEHAACDAVREIRLKLNLSQSQMAEQLGCNRRTLIRWEQHHWAPGMKQITKLQQLAQMLKSVDTRDRKAPVTFSKDGHKGKTPKKPKSFKTAAWYRAGVPRAIWKRMTPEEREDTSKHEEALARICLKILNGKGGTDSGQRV